MLIFLVCLTLCADEQPKAEPIPKYVRRYFERCDSAKEAMQDGFKKELELLAVRIQSTPAKARKGLIREREQIEKSLRELNATQVRAWMPDKADIGEVGYLKQIKVKAVLDKHTMVTTGASIIKGLDTTGYTSGKAIPQDEMFRVTSKFPDPEKLQLAFGGPTGGQWELERIPRGEVMKWREQYDKEKAEAQKKAKEAEAKPEAEPKPKPVKLPVKPPVKVSMSK